MGFKFGLCEFFLYENTCAWKQTKEANVNKGNGDCGGPVDGQEVIINKACGLYLITAKIRKRERERLYIYASYSSYRADSI